MVTFQIPFEKIEYLPSDFSDIKAIANVAKTHGKIAVLRCMRYRWWLLGCVIHTNAPDIFPFPS